MCWACRKDSEVPAVKDNYTEGAYDADDTVFNMKGITQLEAEE